MASKNQLKITAEPGKQEVFIVREFEAPREDVFEIYTNPEYIIKWLGPKDLTMKIDYYHSKSGGSYRYIHSDDKGNHYGFHGVIHEVTAPERVIQTFEFEGMPERGHVSLDTVLFEALPYNRTKVIIHAVFPSVADRDGMMRSGMERGVNDGFERLDEILETSKQTK
jgi:uncharacterized protein YndB with AHSA1/START domain